MFTNKMLGPVIKKKKGIFIAMILIVMITSFLASGFSTAYFAYRKNTDKFFNEYIYPDVTLITESNFDKTKVTGIKDIEGVETFESRATLYKATYRSGSYKTIKITSFGEDTFTKFYTVANGPKSSTYINCYIDYVFGQNNDYFTSKKVDLYGTGGGSKTVNVQKMVATTETTHPMIQHQYAVDKYNFGYMFIEEKNLKELFPSEFGYNEIVVKLKSGYTQSTIANKINTLLNDKGIKVESILLKENSEDIRYLYHSIIDYFQILAITVPLIFVVITIFLFALFQYEISKSMTREMGILNALGVKKKSLFNLLFRFNLRVSLIGLVGGVAGGFGFANIIYNICKSTYGMPLGMANFNIYVTIVIVLVFLLVSIITSLFTLFSIRKLSPKQAMINAMDQNKPLPRGIDKLTKRTVSMNLACNSMHKNKVRLFVSLFAIIISSAITYAGISYTRNASVFVNEFGERMQYDAQVFSASKDSGNVEVLKTKLESYTTDIEYTYSNDVKYTFKGKSRSATVCGIESNSKLVYIPGNLKPTGNGLILEKNNADRLGAKAGDYIDVTFNDTTKSIKVDAVSDIVSQTLDYMSIDTYQNFFKTSSGIDGFKSLLIKFSNNNKNNIYKVAVENEGIPLFTAEAVETYTKGARLIIIVAYVCAGISLVIGLVTIKIMCTASLEDQKKKLSTLRVLGFSNKKTYRVFKDEVLTYLIVGLIPGIPIGIGLNSLIANIASSDTFHMKALNIWWVFLVTIAFVILVVYINLLIGKKKIKKWDIAENTRNRE